MKKGSYAERFTGITLAINPIFTFIGLIWLIFSKTPGLFKKIKTDRMNLYFWGALALSGIISVFLAKNQAVAIGSFFIPFAFFGLYIVGRWKIENPQQFIQDMVIGAGFLALIAIIAKLLQLEWYIGNVPIFRLFDRRGEILFVANNGLGLLFQAGAVGALGLILAFPKRKNTLLNFVALVLCLFGLVVCASRGAMMATLVAFCYLIFRFNWKAVFGFGAFAVVMGYFGQKRFFSTFDMAEHSERLQIWSSSLKIVKDHLWFGVGPGNFGQVYAPYKPSSLKIDVTCAHSNYLNIVIGWGIIGGIIFWGWQLFILVRAAIKGLTPLQRVILAVLISFYVHVTINELFAAYAGFLLGLMDHSSFNSSDSEKVMVKN